ncbi:MAG: fumarylacetoacetate hydrolase family protein [Rhodospirillaceae bacterium]|nr:fumarylacetoacetate hydrolase family protein [Rhodospirillaceae bacterium]
MSIDFQQAVEDFWAARQPGGLYPIHYKSTLTQSDAYRINLALLERHAARGEPQAGWKVGLTAEAIRKQFGLPEPLFACLFKHRRWQSGGTWPLKAMNEPGFENELCLILGERLEGPGVTEERAKRAIAAVAPAMEIIETRGPNSLDGMMPMIADNGQQYAFVTGPEVKYDPVSHDLSRASVEIYIDDVFQERAYGNAVMESSPIASIVWLANKLAEFGVALEPGETVMTGSFTRQYKIDRPMKVEARFAPFGSAVATFA